MGKRIKIFILIGVTINLIAYTIASKIINNKQENNKLPITGQESILGVLGLLAVSIGGIIYKKKK